LRSGASGSSIEYARCGDQWLAYTIGGQGPLDVVFVSPLMSNVEVVEEPLEVRRMFDRLRSFGRLIRFDRRGAGLSDPVPGLVIASVEEWSDDLIAVLDAVSAQQVCLFTFDSGAPYALLFAAAHPERVRSVALIEPLVPYLNTIGGPGDMRDLTIATIEAGWGSGVILPAFSPRAAGDPNSAAWWARFERLSMSRGVAVQAMGDFMLLDARPAIRSVQASVLIAHAPALGSVAPLTELLDNVSVVEVDHTDLHWWWNHDLASVMLDAVETHFTGRPVEPDTDRVLATVLFTDIVGSTARAAEVGDRRWTQLLEAHDQIVETEVNIHHGTVIKSTGDGCLATFDGPARAVRCAARIRDAVERLGISLRSGVHTGEIERRGTDIGGLAVNVAARIMAHAGPGEVFVSRTVRDLVVGSGLSFTERGDYDLKGVPDRWTVLALAQ